MDFTKSHQRKRSTDFSTATPYIIPGKLMDQSKNLRTMIYRDQKPYEQSKVSTGDNYFIRTKLDFGSDTETRYELRPSLKPKIPNRLNLQLPQKKQLTIRRYVGEEKQIQQKAQGLFSKIFRCCVDPKAQNREFQECDYCENRVYKNKSRKLSDDGQSSQEDRKRQQTQPYISYRRMQERQKQPVQVFYQQVTNQQIQNNRYGDDSNQKGNIKKSTVK